MAKIKAIFETPSLNCLIVDESIEGLISQLNNLQKNGLQKDMVELPKKTDKKPSKPKERVLIRKPVSKSEPDEVRGYSADTKPRFAIP